MAEVGMGRVNNDANASQYNGSVGFNYGNNDDSLYGQATGFIGEVFGLYGQAVDISRQSELDKLRHQRLVDDFNNPDTPLIPPTKPSFFTSKQVLIAGGGVAGLVLLGIILK